MINIVFLFKSRSQNQTNSAKLYIVCVLEQKYDNGNNNNTF